MSRWLGSFIAKTAPETPAQGTDTLTSCRGQCRNGVAEFQEQCDGVDRRSQTCQSVTIGALPYGIVRCNAMCNWDTSECTTQRFIDNGDSMITNAQTGLMWEQRVGNGPICDTEYLRKTQAPSATLT